MSDTKSFQCPNCGSPIVPSGGDKEVKCAYCGSTVIVPEELRDHRPPADFSIPQPDQPSQEVLETIGNVGKVAVGVTAGATVMSFILPIILTCVILGAVGGVLYFVFSSVNSSNQPSGQAPNAPSIPFIASPTTVPTPVPYTKVLFKDNFTDPSSGWERARNANYTLEYKNGKYHVLINNEPGAGQAIWITKSFTDMSVEVDTQQTAGPSDGLIGVACRATDDGRMYSFEYSQDGTYGIYKYAANGANIETLDENQLNPNTVIQGGVNHLEGVCAGDTLTLILNGQVLDQVVDSEFTKGGMGVIVRSGASGDSGNDVLFSNYVVKGP